MTNTEAIRILTLERDDWETSHCTPMERKEAFEMAIAALTKEAWKEKHPVSPLLQKLATNLQPSKQDDLIAQPETHEKRTETHSCDCISRQDAIDAIFSEPLYKSGMKIRDADVIVPAIYEKIKSLPSAQPETHEKRTETHACDCIDRKAAIDALKEHRALFCDNTPDTFSKLSYAEKSRVDELDMAIATLINLPPAQPEKTQLSEEDTTFDCISRQDAIDAIFSEPLYQSGMKKRDADVVVPAIHEKIKSLPSAQPDLPEWAQKVEEYRQNAPQHIHNPLAWALYQVWKEYDR